MPDTRKYLIDQGGQKLKESGIPSYRLEAEILLCFLLDCDREKVISEPNGIVPEEVAERYGKLIAKRCSRYPFQYLIHKQEFYSLEFYVDERVLIPRPESELLIDALLEVNQASSPWLVDIGTGSGNLAITASVRIPEASVFALDRSYGALEVAHRNARKHKVSDRVLLVQADFLDCFAAPSKGALFDVILANPPYIPLPEMAHLQEEVKKFEPSSSLVAGEDGLQAYRRIIPSAYPLLKNGGYLIIEIGATMAKEVLSLLKISSLDQVSIKKDLQGMERVLVAQKG